MMSNRLSELNVRFRNDSSHPIEAFGKTIEDGKEELLPLTNQQKNNLLLDVRDLAGNSIVQAEIRIHHDLKSIRAYNDVEGLLCFRIAEAKRNPHTGQLEEGMHERDIVISEQPQERLSWVGIASATSGETGGNAEATSLPAHHLNEATLERSKFTAKIESRADIRDATKRNEESSDVLSGTQLANIADELEPDPRKDDRDRKAASERQERFLNMLSEPPAMESEQLEISSGAKPSLGAKPELEQKSDVEAMRKQFQHALGETKKMDLESQQEKSEEDTMTEQKVE